LELYSKKKKGVTRPIHKDPLTKKSKWAKVGPTGESTSRQMVKGC